MFWNPTQAPVTTHDTLDILISRKPTALIQNLSFLALLPMNQNGRTQASYDLPRTTLYERNAMSGPALAGQYTGRRSCQYNWAQ